MFICSCMEKAEQSQTQTHMYGDDDVETDGNHKKTHYRGNSKKAGHIVYTVSIASYMYIQ